MYIRQHFALWYLFMCMFNRLQYGNFLSHSNLDSCALVKILYAVVQVFFFFFTFEDFTTNLLLLIIFAFISDIIIGEVTGVPSL